MTATTATGSSCCMCTTTSGSTKSSNHHSTGRKRRRPDFTSTSGTASHLSPSTTSPGSSASASASASAAVAAATVLQQHIFFSERKHTRQRPSSQLPLRRGFCFHKWLWYYGLVWLCHTTRLTKAQIVGLTPQRCTIFLAASDLNRDDKLNQAPEFTRFASTLAGTQYAAFAALPPAWQSLYTKYAGAAELDIAGARPGTPTTPAQTTALTNLCQEAIGIVSGGATPVTAVPAAVATPVVATPVVATPVVATPAAATPAAVTIPFPTCRTQMAVSDTNRDNQLAQTEYVAFLNRLTANRRGFTTFAALSPQLQQIFTTQGPAGQIPITGASPVTFASATAAQKATLETICTDVQVALDSATPATAVPAGTIAPAVTPGAATTTTPAVATPAAVTIPFPTCRIQMAVSDTNRDNQLAQTEYVTFLNRLTANQRGFTAFAALPPELQSIFTAQGPAGQIPITGASPVTFASATAAQKATLEKICTDVQVALSSATPATTGPATLTPATLTPGTPATVAPATPAAAGATPAIPLPQCRVSMAIVDTNRDSQLSQAEYVAFVNRLTRNAYVGQAFAGLPVALQTNFNTLAAGAPSVDITGASPAQFGASTPVQQAHLETICTDTQAITTAPVVAAVTTPPATVIPATSTLLPGAATLVPGAGSVAPGGTLFPGSMAPGTLTPGGSMAPGTLFPGGASVAPGTLTPGTLFPGSMAPGTPGTLFPGSMAPGTLFPGASAAPGTLFPAASATPGTLFPGASAAPGTLFPGASGAPGTLIPGASVAPGTGTLIPGATAVPGVPQATAPPRTPISMDVCKQRMVGVDTDKDGQLAGREFIDFANALAAPAQLGVGGTAVTTFPALPANLQAAFPDLATPPGGSTISIAGANPALGVATPEQTLNLERICTVVDEAIYEHLYGSLVTMAPTPRPTVDLNTGIAFMQQADVTRDQLLRPGEYIAFLNLLSGNAFVGAEYISLDPVLIENYGKLAAVNVAEGTQPYDPTLINIFGLWPEEVASEGAKQHLNSIVLETNTAIQTVLDAPAIAETVPPSTVAPQTTAPLPTEPPADMTGNATVFSSFIIYNRLNILAANLGPDSKDRQDLEQAYSTLVQTYVLPTYPWPPAESSTKPPTAGAAAAAGAAAGRRLYLRRRRLIAYKPNSGMIQDIQDIACPEDANLGVAYCQMVYARYNLEQLPLQQATEIKVYYQEQTQIAINKKLQTQLVTDFDETAGRIEILRATVEVQTADVFDPAASSTSFTQAIDDLTKGTNTTVLFVVLVGLFALCGLGGYFAWDKKDELKEKWRAYKKSQEPKDEDDDEDQQEMMNDENVEYMIDEDGNRIMIIPEEEEYEGEEGEEYEDEFDAEAGGGHKFGKKGKRAKKLLGKIGKGVGTIGKHARLDNLLKFDADGEEALGLDEEEENLLDFDDYVFDTPAELLTEQNAAKKKLDEQGGKDGTRESTTKGAGPLSASLVAGGFPAAMTDPTASDGSSMEGSEGSGDDEDEDDEFEDEFDSDESDDEEEYGLRGGDGKGDGSYKLELSESGGPGGEEDSISSKGNFTRDGDDSLSSADDADVGGVLFGGEGIEGMLAAARDNKGEGIDGMVIGGDKPIGDEENEDDDDDENSAFSDGGSSYGSDTTTSSAEKRLEEYRKEVKELVAKVIPDELDNLSTMMDQFEGREAELINTLQNMEERTSTQRARAAVHKTKLKVNPNQVGGYSIASEGSAVIAAASTLGPEPQRRQPRVQQYDDYDDEGSYYSDEDGSYYSDEYSDEGSYYSDEEGSYYDDEEGSYYDDEEGSYYSGEEEGSYYSGEEEGSYYSGEEEEGSYIEGEEESYVSGEGSYVSGEGSYVDGEEGSYVSGEGSYVDGEEGSYVSGEGSYVDGEGSYVEGEDEEGSYDDEEGSYYSGEEDLPPEGDEEGSYYDDEEGSYISGEEEGSPPPEGEEEYDDDEEYGDEEGEYNDEDGEDYSGSYSDEE